MIPDMPAARMFMRELWHYATHSAIGKTKTQRPFPDESAGKFEVAKR
jgi:hypothetical protein